MKNLLILLIGFILLLTSCNSSKKNLQKGNYDEIIAKSVKKLIKNPDNNKDAILLDKAYKLANERDLDALKFLKLDGQPDSWDNILHHYELLNIRQKKLKPILPIKLNGKLTTYKQVDYDLEIVEAKRKAAAYFYANGKRLLESSDKLLIRQAYGELVRAKSYTGSSYLDLDNLIREAEFKGISRVFVQIVNTSLFNFPHEFMAEIISGNTEQLNTDWVHYFFKQTDDRIEFDYLALVKIENVQVSPDDVKTIDRIYKKNIEDGFEYLLDSRGNVKKDTVGNDIKEIKYKAIQCAVVETIQHKEAQLTGEIEFIEFEPIERLIVQKPFGTETVFHHVSARAIGDLNALDEDAKQLIKISQIPFPSDQELVFNNAIRVQEAIHRLLRSNQAYFK
ncbi:MAG: hypothetical protein PF484_08160 [Bacteroidales bacterium]|jgi:hypothetical protein|nr:hypothetical protein [Bacteroidales bacterium]